MNTPIQQHAAPKPIPPLIRDGEHYSHLLGRSKGYIFLSFPVVFLIVAVIMFVFVRPENPELTAQTLIGLETSSGIPVTKTGSAGTGGREDIMLSRTFLKDVVEKLSLQLWTAPVVRSALFDSVRVDSGAPCGVYTIKENPEHSDEYVVTYYDSTAVSVPLVGFVPGIGNGGKIIATGKWASQEPLAIPLTYVTLSRSLRQSPHPLKFRIVDIRLAVESVYRDLTVKRAEPNKGINYIAVLVAGRDYAVAAATANAIAEAFIDKNVSFSSSRTRGVLLSLEGQLKAARDNLDAAESRKRDFRSRNPQVDLDPQSQQAFGNLAALDNGIQSMSGDLSGAARLQSAFADADFLQQQQIAMEITELLATQSVSSGRPLGDALKRLTAQQLDLNSDFGAEHPQVLENNRSIKKVLSSISASLDEYINTIKSRILRKQQNVQRLSSTVRQLPGLEMQLGEVERNRKIYGDIYAAVLSNYNQAKVANAVETADFYMMDYAVAPLPPPSDKSKVVASCIFLALLLSFGPVLILDLLDKSVRSQRQLSRLTGHAVLEAIPIFYPADADRRKRKTISHPLITVPTDPSFTKEVFESLMLKMKLLLSESDDFAIALSSFEGGCGKSTVSSNLAITLAKHGHRTILVDGDLRRGTVKEIFKLADSGGLAELLSKRNPLTDEECTKAIIETTIPNLFVIPCGKEPGNPGALLASPRMEEFKRFCLKRMTYMIVDTPPLGAVSDAVMMQKFFNHYIFIVRSGKTNVADFVKRINEFDQLSQKTLGYVLNGASHDAVGGYQRYSKYYVR